MTVAGRVQGVGFRWFVLRHARRLGLCGTVRNLADGHVEIIAVGQEGEVKQLAALAERGPDHAAVSGVKIEWIEPPLPFDSFEVTY